MRNRIPVENPILWDGVFDLPVTREHRIAICTTCMNRLDDLRLTLPDNIAANSDYENLEFVLLDYNSRDGLSNWIQDRFPRELASGRLRYFHTTEPEFYEMGHSRNLAFALADADLVTNVDADNWALAGFARHLNCLANQVPVRGVFIKSWQRMNGRVAFYKSEWQSLGGYDESFVGYGFDDADLVCRALAQGFTLARFGGEYCRRIHTSSKAKIANLSDKGWRKTQEANRAQSEHNLRTGRLRANEGQSWGKGIVLHNFATPLRVLEGRYETITGSELAADG